MSQRRNKHPLTATIVGLIGAFGCGSARAPAARGAAPTSLASGPASPPTSAAERVVSPPAPDPLAGVDPACRGADLSFDTEESEAKCRVTHMDQHAIALPAANELDMAASVAEKSIHPGGTATVIVTLTNKTKTPLLLDVDLTCDDEPTFPISVFDAGHRRRIDLVSHKNCDTETFGCTRRVSRVVLEPGGSFRRKRLFTANVTKVVADCGEVTAGPMRPGIYVLQVVSGIREKPDEQSRRRLETTLVVK